MKMKKISAASIQEALAMARKELGEDAVLLETKKGVGKGVIVTFAVDEPDEDLFAGDFANDDIAPHIIPFSAEIKRPATAKAEINHPAIDLINEALEYHAVPDLLRQRMLINLHKTRLKPDSVIEVAETALADVLTTCIPFAPIATALKSPPPRALMFVGPHGAGKTSAIAKLATELTLKKQKIVLISTDLERLGGTDSLAKLSAILSCEFHICESRAELKAVIAAYQQKSWILIDSTGANIYAFKQMKTLGELASLPSIEPILVCPAGMDADEAREMAGVFDFLTIERMIITRLDAVRRLKSLFSVHISGGYALANFSNSASPSDACQPLTPIALSRLMLRHARDRLA